MRFTRYIHILFGALLLGAAIFVVSKDLSARRLLITTQQIQRGISLTDGEADYLANYPGNQDLPCRLDVQEAAMSVKLAVLQRRLTSTVPTAKVEQAYWDAKQGIDHLLSCFPLNGNGWMRLAISRMWMEGPTEDVLQAIEISQLTSPREAWILETRIPFLLSFSQTQDPRVIEVLDRDLDTSVRWMPVWQIRSIYETVGDYGKSVMRDRISANADVISAIDPDRLEKLYRMTGLKTPGDGCARYFSRLDTCVGNR